MTTRNIRPNRPVVLLNVNTTDALGVFPKPTKQFMLGTVWEGDSKPRLDFFQEAPKDLVISLTTGEIRAEFPAEAGSPNFVDPGAVWNGIAEQLERAAKSARAKAEDVRIATGDARRDFGDRARQNTLAAITAMQEGARKLWAGRDGSPTTMPAPTRDARAPQAQGIAAINEANRRFWADRHGGPKDAA